jgi:hypothetical protein
MLLLDTSFLIEFERERANRRTGPAIASLAARPLEPVAISIITLSEFAEGFESPVDVESFISRFRVVQLSRSIAYRTAAIQSACRDAWAKTMRGSRPLHSPMARSW